MLAKLKFSCGNDVRRVAFIYAATFARSDAPPQVPG